jgi:hypothetical protein
VYWNASAQVINLSLAGMAGGCRHAVVCGILPGGAGKVKIGGNSRRPYQPHNLFHFGGKLNFIRGRTIH